MAAIDNIVNVSITLQVAQGSTASFSSLLVAGYHNFFSDRVRTYASDSALEDMVSDGFPTTHPIYLKVQAVLLANPHITEVKVGRRNNSWTQKTDITPTFTASVVNDYSGEVDGEAWTFSSDITPSLAEICTGIAAAINGTAAACTADGTSGTKVVVTNDADETLISINNTSANLTVDDTTVDTTMAADLAVIRAVDDKFYGLQIDSDSNAGILAAAAYAETQKMLFVPTLRGTRVLNTSDTTDTATTLKNGAYKRTAAIYHSDARVAAGAAWMGVMFPNHPSNGSQWGYKQLSGITPDQLTTSQINAIQGKGVNVQQLLGSQYVALKGVTFEGSTKFIDLRTGIDALESDIQLAVLNAILLDLPYTNKSADIICNEILQICRTYQTRGFLSLESDPVCTHPDVRTISSVDRAERRLPDINFSAQAASRVGSVIIRGKVVV